MTQKNYYKTLQVDSSADPEVIDVAYKRLARKYHPDINKSHDATARMQELNEAYATLGNPILRAEYGTVVMEPIIVELITFDDIQPDNIGM